METDSVPFIYLNNMILIPYLIIIFRIRNILSSRCFTNL